jgi:hypothetical protein
MRAKVVLAARKEQKMSEQLTIVRGYLTVNEGNAANVEEPLLEPEPLFPILPGYEKPESAEEGNEPPDLAEWLKRKKQ